MATLTPDNPFDTQQPKATNTGIVGGAMQTAAPTAGQLPTNVGTSAPVTPNAATYAPTTRQVNQPTDTVQGQVDSILSKDSPLMQRARTMATQQMAQRGLVNSSMAVGAGQAAMVDRALPMAQQDASTYNQVAQENMNALNQSGQFNAGEINRFGLQKNEQQFQSSLETAKQNFTAAQANLDRAQQTALQVGQQEFQSAQAKIQNDFNMQMQTLQESGLDFRQARDIASREALVKLEQMGIQNRFDQEIALKDKQFSIEQYNLDRRQLIANQNELDKLGLQIKANNAQIPTQFAANISNTAMTGVNTILADGSLKPEQKQAAIDNVVNYANSQIDWASKFYGTPIPSIGTPSTPAFTPPPAPAAPAPAATQSPVATEIASRPFRNVTSSR